MREKKRHRGRWRDLRSRWIIGIGTERLVGHTVLWILPAGCQHWKNERHSACMYWQCSSTHMHTKKVMMIISWKDCDLSSLCSSSLGAIWIHLVFMSEQTSRLALGAMRTKWKGQQSGWSDGVAFRNRSRRQRAMEGHLHKPAILRAAGEPEMRRAVVKSYRTLCAYVQNTCHLFEHIKLHIYNLHTESNL